MDCVSLRSYLGQHRYEAKNVLLWQFLSQYCVWRWPYATFLFSRCCKPLEVSFEFSLFFRQQKWMKDKREHKAIVFQEILPVHQTNIILWHLKERLYEYFKSNWYLNIFNIMNDALVFLKITFPTPSTLLVNSIRIFITFSTYQINFKNNQFNGKSGNKNF